jgi:hypothetical protein
MKYEEWIKYEEIRQSQPKELAWMVWVEYPKKEQPVAINLSVCHKNNLDKANPRLWSLIVQYLNSRKI